MEQTLVVVEYRRRYTIYLVLSKIFMESDKNNTTPPTISTLMSVISKMAHDALKSYFKPLSAFIHFVGHLFKTKTN